jgi:hypothetical protein
MTVSTGGDPMIDYLTQAFRAADRLPPAAQIELAGRILADILSAENLEPDVGARQKDERSLDGSPRRPESARLLLVERAA